MQYSFACANIYKLSVESQFAPLAQLDRASGYGPEGQGFESLTACQLNKTPAVIEIAGVFISQFSVLHAVYNLPQLGNRGAYLIQQMKDKLIEHKQYIAEHGLDLPKVAEWKWSD